jgi:hypothetical protein
MPKLSRLSVVLFCLLLTGCSGPYSGVKLLGPLVPHGVREGYDVREWILENGSALSRSDPRNAMDAIYLESLSETGGDKGAAYLATLISVFEHRHIPLNLGLFTLDIPLTLESDSIFRSRVGHLPRNIYGEGHDDRDKLQHFFANSWLKREVGMEWLVTLFGELVEIGEDAVVVGGVYDDRDKIANRDGIMFAMRSGDSLAALPSNYLSRTR